MQVLKRNGNKVPFDVEKIKAAVNKAASRTSPNNQNLANIVAERVSYRITGDTTVEEIHSLVENALMDSGEHDTAREYITYRFSHKPSIFKKRTNLKPYEYPNLLEYVDAIRHSYWVHTEFNFTSDIQDFHTRMTKEERQVVTRTMLAISQIEVAVKTFWSKIGDTMPKPEIQAVGVTFGESEVRHADAYSELLEVLGLNKEFEELGKVPAMANRLEVLERAIKPPVDNEEFVRNILLFSVLIENASLFSQFFIMMSFNKDKNLLKGISNAVQATSKEEDIHAQFGVELVNIVRDEHPELFTEHTESAINALVSDFFRAEFDVLCWIFEGVEEDYLKEMSSTAFDVITYRVCDALSSAGLTPTFERPQTSKFSWFLDETMLSSNVDFFYKKATAYTKGNKSFDADDLF